MTDAPADGGNEDIGSAAEKLFEFLRKERPKAFCDDCLGELLSIKPRQAVNARTEAFGLCREFTREQETCSRCEKVRKAISAN